MRVCSVTRGMVTTARLNANERTVTIVHPYPLRGKDPGHRVPRESLTSELFRLNKVEDRTRWRMQYEVHPQYVHTTDRVREGLQLEVIYKQYARGMKTPMGKALFREWFTTPVRELSVLRERHAGVQHFKAHEQVDAIRRALSQVVRPVTFTSMVSFLTSVAQLSHYDARLRGLFQRSAAQWRLMKEHVVQRAGQAWKGHALVQSYVPALKRVYGAVTVEEYGGMLCFKVQSNARKRPPLLVKQTKKHVWFTTQKLATLNRTSYVPWKESMEQANQSKEARMLSACDVTELVHRVAHMDVYVSLPAGTLPTYNASSIRLINMRHPCVQEAVPLTVEHRTAAVHVMTGSSTSGKTTWLRSCMLAAYLHQVGVPLPCESASLPLFDQFDMVGTTSSDAWGQSTFMQHVSALKEGLMSSTVSSLIGLDEPCQCTNTREATELARMVLSAMQGTRLVTTHLVLRSPSEYHLSSYRVVQGRSLESGAMGLCETMGMGDMVRLAVEFQEKYINNATSTRKHVHHHCCTSETKA